MSLIQIGVIGLRTPDGKFTTTTPIMRDLPEAKTKYEEKTEEEVTNLFVETMRNYINETKKIKRGGT
jgi:hypothetical protein